MAVSSINFSGTPTKTFSGKSCKNLSTIRRSDQELWTIWAGTLVWPDETPLASHGHFIAMPQKQASWNSYKNLSMIQRSDQELRTSWAGTLVWSWSCPTRRCRCRVAILVRRQGKPPPETHVKLWGRSNGGSRVTYLLSRYSSLVRQDTTIVSRKFHCDAKETSLLKLL